MLSFLIVLNFLSFGEFYYDFSNVMDGCSRLSLNDMDGFQNWYSIPKASADHVLCLKRSSFTSYSPVA